MGCSETPQACRQAVHVHQWHQTSARTTISRKLGLVAQANMISRISLRSIRATALASAYMAKTWCLASVFILMGACLCEASDDFWRVLRECSQPQLNKLEQCQKLLDDPGFDKRFHPMVLDTMAGVHATQGDYDKAISYREQALASWPSEPDANLSYRHEQLGLLYKIKSMKLALAGHIGAARAYAYRAAAAYSTAIQVHVLNHSAYARRADAYYFLCRTEDGQRDITEAKRIAVQLGDRAAYQKYQEQGEHCWEEFKRR